MSVECSTAGFWRPPSTPGIRPNCRPLLHFKDNLKANLLSMGIDPTTWEDLADNRSKWWKACITEVQHFEEVCVATAVEKRSQQKGSTSQSVRGLSNLCRDAVTSRDNAVTALHNAVKPWRPQTWWLIRRVLWIVRRFAYFLWCPKGRFAYREREGGGVGGTSTGLGAGLMPYVCSASSL